MEDPRGKKIQGEKPGESVVAQFQRVDPGVVEGVHCAMNQSHTAGGDPGACPRADSVADSGADPRVESMADSRADLCADPGVDPGSSW